MRIHNVGECFNMPMRLSPSEFSNQCFAVLFFMHCRYYWEVLRVLASFPFNNTYVHLPPHNVPIPEGTIQSSSHTLQMSLVQLMEHTSGAVPLLLSGSLLRITKDRSPKICLPSAGLTWYSTTSWWDGMGLPQTHTCTTMHGWMTLQCWRDVATLQMQGLASAMLCWCHIEECFIILQSGVMHKWGESLLCLLLL